MNGHWFITMAVQLLFPFLEVLNEPSVLPIFISGLGIALLSVTQRLISASSYVVNNFP